MLILSTDIRGCVGSSNETGAAMATSEHHNTLSEIREQLERLRAADVSVKLTADFDPQVGVLVRVDYRGAYWHLLPSRFLEILTGIDDSGGAAVRQAIEREGHGVWHGPSPPDSREELT